MIDFVWNPSSRATLACTVVFLVCLISGSSGQYEAREASNGVSNDRIPGNEFRSCTDGKCIKRTTEMTSSGMWFGPRLGRRRRSDEKSDVDSEIEAIAGILDGARWAIITVPGEKRQTTQFTPRLGRESAEDFVGYGSSKDRNDIQEDDSLAPLFGSRPGRRVPWTPTPRLGRQLHAIFRKM